MNVSRPPFVVTLSVWKALFLRESMSRLLSARGAWFWLLFEPVFHVVYLVFIFTVVRVTSVGGVDSGVWIINGLLGFFMFDRTGSQARNALSANRALFAYRQVKPVDAVLVRGGLEGFLMIVVAIILYFGAALSGHSVLPADPLGVLEAFFGLWLLGLGFGLITSVACELVAELGKILGFVMMPMYMISGVMFPVASLPVHYRDWLMLNPVVHGLEAVRLGFAPYYHAVPDLSLRYLYCFAIVIVFFGLALHRRFALRLTML